MRRGSWCVALVALAALLLGSLAPAGAAGARTKAKLPSPGTPAQVAAAVAASHAIRSLPSDLVPALSALPDDNAALYFRDTGQGCAKVTSCVFGDRAASATVVLFGDSHAAMWLPPLSWVGEHLEFRLVLLWEPGCPATDVTVWDPLTHRVDSACTTWRAEALKAIVALQPALVLTSNRTTNVEGAHDTLIPGTVWKAGLERTLATLLAAKLHVAVIGDVTAFTQSVPQCLVAYPTDVQRCSSPNPNPALHTHHGAEVAAAKAEDVPYLDPEPWLCTKVCSPIVGDLAVFNDWQHVSATYAAYLGIDWEDTLRPLLATDAVTEGRARGRRPAPW